MVSSTLDLTSLKRVIEQLIAGYARYALDPSDEQIKDGLIHRFELTYELSHQTLKRYLELSAPSGELDDAMIFADLIKTAFSKSLIKSNWTQWKIFKDMRSRSSQCDDEKHAIALVSRIPSFIEEVKFLLHAIDTKWVH
jgi:nucleotidyltransferase substrate binding protein (TIGR01987 family)